MVLKPATARPFLPLRLPRAGVPKGEFSVVTGGAGAIGGELTGNPIVRKVSFTVSSEIGKILMKQVADTVKKCSMELGGNAHVIVFGDADLDLAVKGALISKYRNGRSDPRLRQPSVRAGRRL